MRRTVYEVSAISPRQSLIYCGRFVNERDARDKYAELLATKPDCQVDLQVIEKEAQI